MCSAGAGQGVHWISRGGGAGQGHKWRALTAYYSGGAQNVLSRRADNGISFVSGPTWRTERRALTASYSGGAQNVLVLPPPPAPSNVRRPQAKIESAHFQFEFDGLKLNAPLLSPKHAITNASPTHAPSISTYIRHHNISRSLPPPPGVRNTPNSVTLI